jgi:DNA (cytosine-5)-methyltransferase 1
VQVPGIGELAVNYYNEIEPAAVIWLKELINAGLIPAGDVDDRSIEDVRPADIRGYDQCHFFCGIAGWVHALDLAGWPRDRPVWTGSPPCQPFSAAGKGLGFADERDLQPAWHHLIAQCKPPVVFGEQVEGAVRKGWLDRIASDMEGIGYAFGTAVLQASGVNAPHKRDRLWFVADAQWDEQPWQEPRGGEAGRVGRVIQPFPWDEPWEVACARIRAMDDGLPRCVAATDAARNAIVPQVAAEFVMAYLEAA